MEIIFVSGTGTDVGKTYSACRLAETRVQRGDRVAVYKPVASGCRVGKTDNEDDRIAQDALDLWNAASRPSVSPDATPKRSLHAVCPQRFLAAVAPPQAAIAEGRRIDQSLLFSGVDVWADGPFDVLLIEGAGGLFSPLADSMLNIDYAVRLKQLLPGLITVLVAPNRIGVIHDTVAAVRAAEAAGLKIDQIVLNSILNEIDESSETNADAIRHWTGATVVE